MQEVKIQVLMDRCIKYFEDHCYTENRISVYKCLWRKGIVHYMSAHDIENYSPSIGEEFLSTCHHYGEIRHQEREMIRSIQVLDDMLSLGLIRKRCFTPVFHTLDGKIGMEMEKLLDPDDLSVFALALAGAAQGQQWHGQLRWQNDHSSTTTSQVTITPIRDAEGTHRHFLMQHTP